MFESLKIRIIIKKIENISSRYEFKSIYKNYKTEIENSYDIFLSVLNKGLELNCFPSDISFKDIFSKFISQMDDSILLKIVDSGGPADFLINRQNYPMLGKNVRVKCLSYYGNSYYNFDFDDIINTDDIIEAYRTNENLIPLLKKRLEGLNNDELISYVNMDENIALLIPDKKMINLINDGKISDDILYKIYVRNNDFIKYIDYSAIFRIMQEHPEKINSILLSLDANDSLALYNINREFFNNILLEHPNFIKDNISFIAYILMNNQEMIKKQLSHLFKYDSTGSLAFGNDFFLDNRVYCNILKTFGSKKFIEFLKYYPLFGASEKPYGAMNERFSAYNETQSYHNFHYYLDEPIDIDNVYNLIDVDINYLFNVYNFGQDSMGKMPIDYNLLKQNILNLLHKFFLENGLGEKYNSLISSVEKIFNYIDDEKVLVDSNGYQSFRIKKYELIKILFNIDIVSKNTPQDINDYISSCYDNSDNSQQKFYTLFENAYGINALNIIKSRPGLDPLTINSLDIFRPEVINNFGEGFVHDLLSYNIKGFTNFLMITKNLEELTLFIDYYQSLCKIFGENVMTMEKAFINFYYYKDLIKSIQGVDLSEVEQQNLVSVLSGNLNYHNVNSREDLMNYNKIANEKLLVLLKNCKSVLEFKNIICNDLFGIDYNVFEISYNFVIKELSTSSFTQDFISSLTDSERNIMEFLKYICRYDLTLENLQSFVENIIDSGDIRNPLSCVSLLNKIRAREIEEINKSLSTKQCLEDLVKEGNLIKNEYDGVPIYCYTKGDDAKSLKSLLISRVLKHDTFLTIHEMSTLEPDNGASTISTWYAQYGQSTEFGDFGFYQLPLDTQVVASKPDDGETSKLSKSVHAKGLKGGFSYQHNGINIDPSSHQAEISFYRRHRDHKNITNENHGGLIIPNCFFQMSLNNIEYAKQVDGIIICSYDEYCKFIEKLKNGKGDKTL